MSLTQKINEGRKAVAALLVPGLIVLGNSLTSGSDGGSDVVASEWVAIIIASLGTSAIVYGIKNGESRNPNTSTPGPGVADDEGVETVADYLARCEQEGLA